MVYPRGVSGRQSYYGRLPSVVRIGNERIPTILYKAKLLKNYTLQSIDGDIGRAEEFYFDDQYWTIRYLVANTSKWLPGRQVLLSPYALTSVNTLFHSISVNLTNQQIEGSPSLDTDIPVSRQYENDYYDYYGWPLYYGGAYMWGMSPLIDRDNLLLNKNSNGTTWDAHLRSTNDVDNDLIQALDGEIGHVEDFIIDDETWSIRYVVVDTRNWWPGKKVLIAPEWFTRVSWDESTVFVNLTRDAIKQSPEYTDEMVLNRDYETKLHRHYNRSAYWLNAQPLPTSSR